MTQAHAGCCAGSGQNVTAATRWSSACIPESVSIRTRGGEGWRGEGEGGIGRRGEGWGGGGREGGRGRRDRKRERRERVRFRMRGNRTEFVQKKTKPVIKEYHSNSFFCQDSSGHALIYITTLLILS